MVVAVGAMGVAAPAQQEEFTLTESGEFEQTSAPEPGTDAATIAEARKLLAQGRPAPARFILERWLDHYGGPESVWYPEVKLLLGDAKAASGNEYRALYDYEVITREYSNSEVFVKAIERELDIAVRYVNGLRRKLWGVRVVNARRVGEELLVRVQERLPDSAAAERAAIELGDHYYRIRDMSQASIMYSIFLERYPHSEYRAHAMQRRVYANIARFKGPKYDGSGLLDAQILIREFEREYPADAERAGMSDALIARLDESAAAQMLDKSRWYLRRGDHVSARYVLKRLLKKYNRTVAASQAYQLLAENGWIDEQPEGEDAEAGEGTSSGESANGADEESPSTDPGDEPSDEETPS